MKLNTSVRRIREAAKSLKIDTNYFEIRAKEENCITADTKSIILLVQTFDIYIQIFVFLPTPRNKL